MSRILFCIRQMHDLDADVPAPGFPVNARLLRIPAGPS